MEQALRELKELDTMVGGKKKLAVSVEDILQQGGKARNVMDRYSRRVEMGTDRIASKRREILLNKVLRPYRLDPRKPDTTMIDGPSFAYSLPGARTPRAQGSSGATATVPFAWRGHTKRRTTRAGRAPDPAVRLG